MLNKAEHPDKVRNIVEPHLAAFFNYYKDALCILEE